MIWVYYGHYTYLLFKTDLRHQHLTYIESESNLGPRADRVKHSPQACYRSLAKATLKSEAFQIDPVSLLGGEHRIRPAERQLTLPARRSSLYVRI